MYIMAYAAPVPTDKRTAYETHCKGAAQLFKDHGCSRVVECWGDMIPPGELTSFILAVKAEEGETVAFGWQEWPSKADHEANMQKAMQDPRFADLGQPPMDGKRLIFAGFEVMVDV